MATRISVALPARNAERTLLAAIRSIQTQTFSPSEIVLVDHKSTDSTHSLMKEASKDDPRIQVLQCDGTFVEAANLAWQSSTGEFIARMDSDDHAWPERLEAQYEYMLANPDIGACGTQVRILKRDAGMNPQPPGEGYMRYEKWVNSVISPEQIERERFVDSPIPNPTSLVRRDVMDKLGGYRDAEWAEDYDFWLRMIETGYRIGKVASPLLDWFDGETRATRTRERYSLTLFQKAKSHFLSRIPLVKNLGIAICGAGPIGKEFARFSEQNGIKIHAFIEVNSRQIGNSIGGIPVVPATGISEYRKNAVLIGAVGQPGARKRILRLAVESGYCEGTDFFSVA